MEQALQRLPFLIQIFDERVGSDRVCHIADVSLYGYVQFVAVGESEKKLD